MVSRKQAIQKWYRLKSNKVNFDIIWIGNSGQNFVRPGKPDQESIA